MYYPYPLGNEVYTTPIDVLFLNIYTILLYIFYIILIVVSFNLLKKLLAKIW